MTFEVLVQAAKAEFDALYHGKQPLILVGTATCGRSAGALEVIEAIKGELEKYSVDANIVEVGCIGLCYAEPLITIIKPGQPGICYSYVTPERAAELIAGYLVNDDPLPHYALGTIGEGSMEGIPDFFQSPVLKRQMRRILRNCGLIDPSNINHYLANGGYRGLLKALDLTPEQIIDSIGRSGLRGRGGAGFPTGKKWGFCRSAPGTDKYVICNADEGDPGAFMDRALLESDPHSVLEGMIIAAYTIGASQGYLYVRAEYPLAIERLRTALVQAREKGFLGDQIMESDFSLDIEIFEGAGAFVCGEETALIASIEGRRGMPRPRPPFPAQSGLWGKPTLINNVKTYANVSPIIDRGADWFASVGTEKNKGTAVFALAGKVANSGLVEVPMGITLREIIYEIGGGIPEGKAFKAVQTGGPSGGCLPAALLDTPVDYDSLTTAGSIMGSGGMVVMDEDTCMVDIARYFLDFTQQESCGECVPCRLGTKQMLDILTDIAEGRGNPEDIDLLVEIAEAVKLGALCGLGQTAPNPVLTTIRYFRDEYEDHIYEKRCRAGVCQELFYAPCMNECPCEVDIPAYVSLIGEKRYEEALKVHLDRNPFPSICARVCPHTCEAKCRRIDVDEPVAIRTLKRFLADQETDYLPEIMERPPEQSKRITVVGAGPAGLSAAYFLRRLGHQVTVFEAMSQPGGMLRYGIPEYRLPEKTLDQEIDRIVKMGVEIETGVSLGKDTKLDDLQNEFDAVFIAIGAWQEATMNIPGEEAEGVSYGIDFLRQVASGSLKKLKGKVVVIGGGNTAVDAARTALRLGAQTVTIVYRRTRNEMPAFEEEIEQAEQEGIQLVLLASPLQVIASDDKKPRVTGLKCQKMTLGDFDRSGRRRPVPIEGEEFVIEADAIISAIGQSPPSLGDCSLELRDDGTIKLDKYSLETSVPGVFAGGDVALGPATVVEAVAQGKRAAEAIEKHVNPDAEIEIPWKKRKPLDTFFDPEAEPVPCERAQPPIVTPNKRSRSFREVECCISESSALREAQRCLRCDYGKNLESNDG